MENKLIEIAKYDTFIFDSFTTLYNKNYLDITFNYEIVNLKKFAHHLSIPYTNNYIDKEFVEKLVFNIGLIESINYWKLTIPKNFIINCGFINESQQQFFRKLFYNGLGEFFYRNNIKPDYDTFIEFKCMGKTLDKNINYEGKGSLISIGGGKDSCVTLSILPTDNNGCFMINPKEVMLNCAYTRGYKDEDIYKVKRVLDQRLLDLNNEGYLNGHVPFSGIVAFISFLTCYLNNKASIILSNESSANEANVLGTNINHQYSKSYEFESDFQKYANEYLSKDIKYYSYLRPLCEYQIGMLFASLKEYHPIFKSCNVGSKSIPWKWCGECAKCLFVYSLLSPFLYEKDLVTIFEKDLFKDKNLLPIFIDLIGKGNNKPFDCVGTFEEINYAITKLIKRLDKNNLPYLLDYYYQNYYNEDILTLDLEHQYNMDNSLSEEENKKLKEIINSDRENN